MVLVITVHIEHGKKVSRVFAVKNVVSLLML
jgi:hypothetical protein